MNTVSERLNIRPATNADCEKIQQLVFGVLSEYGLAADLNGTDKDIYDIEANYLNRGGLFEVIESPDGEILGSVGLYPLDNETIELRKMYFAPDIRGRGLGKELLLKMIEKARNLGYLRVYLETASILEQAVHLYENAGFVPTGEKHTPRCDQAYVLELAAK